jgi:hypothetical protein
MMTGRDLIIYILSNNLENEIVIKNGVFVGFMTETEAAEKFEVGVATIRAWYNCGLIDGVKIGNDIYFLKTAVDPRRKGDK